MESMNMVLPDYLQDVKIIGTLSSRMEQLRQEMALTENGLEEEKDQIDVSVEQSPIFLMSKEVRKAYQSGDFQKIKEIENKSKKDLEPIYSNISEHGDKAWFEAEDKYGKRFLMVFNDQGVMWVYPQETVVTSAENGVKFKHVASVGVYSGNSVSGTIFNMEFRSTASEIVEAVLDLAVTCIIIKVISNGIKYAARSFALWMCERAVAAGITRYAFVLPATALKIVTVAVSSVVSFAAIIFLDWIMGLVDKKFFVQTEIYNWDDTHDWKVVNNYEDNAVIAGEGSLSNITIPKKQTPQIPPFIHDIKVLDTSVSYITIVWENDNTFMEGLGTALSLQEADDGNIGFSWALDCPWARNTVQKAVNTVQSDLKSYYNSGNWNKNPLNFQISESDGLPISFAMNAQSKAENNTYQVKINIGAVNMIEVKADQMWNDTGIDLIDSQSVTIKYDSGTWSVNPDCGNIDAEGGPFIAKNGYLLPGSKEGCLVGKIGDGQPFYVGKSLTLSGKSGRLYLSANDDVNGLYGKGYKDNSGELTVLVGAKV